MNTDPAKQDVPKNMYMRSIRSSGVGNRPPRKKKMQIRGKKVCPRGVVTGQIEPCIRP